LEHFPNARIGRLDSDIGKVRNQVDKTLKEFAHGDYDILVGTQMIAKGHDFPNVTLVGVVLADVGLSLPSYRACETTFQLLAQAVGRAGRGDKKGEAIIQTYNPTHYAISLGAAQDYEKFYHREMQMRHVSQYPPFVYLIVMEFSSKNEEKAAESALNLKNELLQQGFDDLVVLGPSSPYFGYLNGVYKKTLTIKTRHPEELKAYLKQVQSALDGLAGVRIRFDVDPIDC
jgi:primosomal protein N' (replication factor Y)